VTVVFVPLSEVLGSISQGEKAWGLARDGDRVLFAFSDVKIVVKQTRLRSGALPVQTWSRSVRWSISRADLRDHLNQTIFKLVAFLFRHGSVMAHCAAPS